MNKLRKAAFHLEIEKLESKGFESFIQALMALDKHTTYRVSEGSDKGFDFLLKNDEIIGGCYCPSNEAKLDKICSDIMKFMCIYFCEESFKFSTIYEVISADYCPNKTSDTRLLTKSDYKTLDIEKVINYYPKYKNNKSLNTKQVKMFYEYYEANKEFVLDNIFEIEFMYIDHIYMYLENIVVKNKIKLEYLINFFNENNIDPKVIINTPNRDLDIRMLFQEENLGPAKIIEWARASGGNEMQIFLQENYDASDQIRINSNLYRLKKLQEEISCLFLDNEDQVRNEIELIEICFSDKHDNIKKRFEKCSSKPLYIKIDKYVNEGIKEGYCCQLGYSNDLTNHYFKKIDWGEHIE